MVAGHISEHTLLGTAGSYVHTSTYREGNQSIIGNYWETSRRIQILILSAGRKSSSRGGSTPKTAQ